MTLLIAAFVARLTLFVLFAVAGLAKLANRDQTREMLAAFGIRDHALTIGAVTLPLVELAIAAALIISPTAFAGALAAALMLAGFAVVIIVSLAQGRRPSCNCFGQLGASPIGPATLFRNLLLMGLSLLMVAAGAEAAATWRLDLVFGVTPGVALAGAAAVIALVLLVLIVAAQLAILNRLARLHFDSPSVTSLSALPKAIHGLAEGTVAPRFGLGDTQGDFVTLDQLLAPRRPVILLFTKADCPPCAAMSSEVERWQRLYADQVAIVRIGEGVADVKKYALLQTNGAVASAYDCWGTPCAVLVLPDGTIGSRAAQGTAAIRALVKRTAAVADLDSVKSA
ncbi:MauE/DoxX family redox-associated membrane protein [Novosphingobium aquae]|uniref:Methylamine utilization protein MauE n=1 Tax=Novosphingobium aquae TaxID=3133435 RepID=A0ABU8S663_9SPHN